MILKRTIAICLLATAAAASPIMAQTGPLVYGTEVFVTMDSDVLSGWTCDLTNFTFEGPDGSVEVIDFIQNGTTCLPIGILPVLPQAFGYGAHGPLYADGPYIYEPFWYSAAFGNHGGVMHLNNTPQAFCTVFERATGLAAQHRQGLRFARLDGLPFALRSLQYLSADTDFEIGNQLTTYYDIGAWINLAPPVLQSNVWNTLNFATLPYDAETITLGNGGGLNFNVAAGTFTASAPIVSLRLADGTVLSSTAADPLVGGNVLIGGNYSGLDLSGLSDVVLSTTTITVSATSPGDQVVIGADFSAATVLWRLEGPDGTFPIAYSPMTSTASPTITRLGAGSTALDGWAIRVPFEPLTLEVRINPGTPTLCALSTPLASPSTGVTRRLWATDGMGGVSFGAVDMSPFTEFYNFVDPAPAGPVGGGPFFGVAFGPLQIQQIALPLGSHPMHVQAGASGIYYWGVPPGSLPVGLSFDVVLVELPTTGGAVAHPVQRLTL